MKIIDTDWLSYRYTVIPKDASGLQVRESRRAFYAGARSILTEVLDRVDKNTELTSLETELDDFKKLVEAGLA